MQIRREEQGLSAMQIRTRSIVQLDRRDVTRGKP